MRLSRALAEKQMDLRLRDKLITEGKITKTELDKYLKSLSDDTNNSQAAEDAPKEKRETTH